MPGPEEWGAIPDTAGGPEAWGAVPDAPPSAMDYASKALNYAPKAITGMPAEAARTAKETYQSAKQDLSETLQPRQAAPDESFLGAYGRDLAAIPSRAGKLVRGVATGVMGVPLSPVYGAAKSLIGRPMAHGIHAIGQLINPAEAAKQTPEGIYEDIREDVGSALGTTTRRAPSTPKAPLAELSQVKAASRAGYNHPDVAAVEIAPQAVRGLANVIQGDLVKSGFRNRPGVGGDAFAEIARMRPAVGANAPVVIADLDNTRRALGRVAKGKDAQGQMTQDAAAAAKAIDHIDDFLPNLKQSQLHAGDAAKANSILQNARKDYAAYKRGSMVEMLQENAQQMAGSNYFGGNLNNNIRQAFRPYGKFRHAKLPGWTPEAKAAVDQIVSGGSKASLANISRNVGRLAPDTKLGIIAHLGALSLSGGYSAGVAAAGYAAKKLGIALTKRNVSKLREILIRDSALQQARQAAQLPRSQTGANALGPFGIGQIPAHEPANPYD